MLHGQRVFGILEMCAERSIKNSFCADQRSK